MPRLQTNEEIRDNANGDEYGAPNVFLLFRVVICGYVYGVASQKRYIGQVHRFGALCTAPNSVH